MKFEFETINELVDFVNETHKKGEYIYRGQTQPWQLKSSVFRIEDEKERELIWKDTCLFCNWIINNERFKNINIDFEKALAIAQHHGYKTDLVDFTSDIEVAAYFATNGTIDKNILGAIWAIEQESFFKLYDVFDFLEKPKLIQVEGLWRIENQKGLFLRDEGGYLVKLVGGADLIFNHDKEYVSERINSQFIYPIPNDLEKEIDRYKSIEISRKNRENYPDILKNAITIKHEIETQSIEENLNEIEWSNNYLWMSVNTEPYQAVSRKLFDEIKININKDGTVDSTEFQDKYEKNKLYEFNISFNNEINIKQEEFEERIQEYAFAMSQFPYTKAQIINSTILYIEILHKAIVCRLNTAYGHEIHDFFRNYFNDDVVRLGFGDNSGISSYCIVPVEYFEHHKTLKTVLDKYKNHPVQPIPMVKKIQLFRLITNIRKMMTETEAIDFWSKFVIPYQFLIRPKHLRIYLPHTLNNFGYA